MEGKDGEGVGGEEKEKSLLLGSVLERLCSFLTATSFPFLLVASLRQLPADEEQGRLEADATEVNSGLFPGASIDRFCDGGSLAWSV